ncbi:MULTISPECIES: TIGR03943 family putative permease subunit [Streptomyces]|uniref:TIGR03943 family putative permease subunit n=1 Tax=Streptomyces TaxID=1883 RepID=UPI0004BE0F10|nr:MULTISPECIES: TIGR03943 family protein [Streptomyces]KOG64069.1 membrane protein [Streptomyces antibioticus]MBG7701627.1 TIGR03943 family protein [Streptomyces sp. MC1]
MNRQAQAAVLFLLGGALLHAGATDLYLRYVKAGLRPLLLASGAVLIAAALATAWYERRRDRERHPHPEPRVAWLLLLPLLALILIAPPALGSYSALRSGTALQKPYGYGPLPAGDPVPLSVVDYASRAAYGHGRSLHGRAVRVTGFLALDHAGRPYLVRMALNCCAADAQPVKIALTGALPPVLRPDAWLEVTGTYAPGLTHDPVNDGPVPYLKVTSTRPVTAPRDPYDETWNT